MSTQLLPVEPQSTPRVASDLVVGGIMIELSMAFGQGAGLPVVPDAGILIHQTYQPRVHLRAYKWQQIRDRALEAARNLGELAGGFARRRGHAEVRESDVLAAIALRLSGGADPDAGGVAPCPVCFD